MKDKIDSAIFINLDGSVLISPKCLIKPVFCLRTLSGPTHGILRDDKIPDSGQINGVSRYFELQEYTHGDGSKRYLYIEKLA